MSARIIDGKAVAAQVRERVRAEVGIESFHHELDASVPESELAELITQLGQDDRVSGILLQLPVPGHIDADAMIELINPRKDVDGLTTTNAGRLVQGREGLVSCTPLGVMELL